MWRLTWRTRIRMVLEALEGVPGTVAVIEAAPLARGLSEAGRPVLLVSSLARTLRRWKGDSAEALPPGDGALGALVGLGVGARDDWEAVLADWSRALRDQGTLVLLDRTAAPEMSRRALAAGLTELEQRRSGRLVVTSGRARLRPVRASSR